MKITRRQEAKGKEQRRIIIKNNKIQEVKQKRPNKKKARIELSDSFNEVLQKLRNNTIQSKKQTKKSIYQHQL